MITYARLRGAAGLSLLVLSCEALGPLPEEPYQGLVELTETVLSFELGGKLERINVHEGQRVEAAATVAVLDDALTRAARAALALEAEAVRAQADLVRTGARREEIQALRARVRALSATETQLEKSLERHRILVRDNSLPQANLDEVEGSHARARAERESLESELALLERGARPQERKSANARAGAAEATLRLEDQRLERHLLKTLVPGRVLDVHVEPGEVVAAGTPIISLGDTRRPFVEVFVPQASLQGIQVGGPVTLRVDSESEAFRGRVQHIARQTEFTPKFLFSERERPNLVVRVRVRIDDPNERLHAGVPAFARFDHSEQSKP